MLQAQYTHGPGIDNPLSMYRGGQSYYYIKDRLGSVIELSDSSGNIVQTYTYDVWGTIIAQTGSLSNPFKYTCREYDSESGLYYYRARYYSSVIGRFMQRDPLGYVDGANVYVYVGNDPANKVDQMGTLFGYGSSYCLAVALGFGYYAKKKYGSSKNDRWKHCYVGCRTGRRFYCTRIEVSNIAAAKEFIDYLGAGTNDKYDYKATMWGYDHRKDGGRKWWGGYKKGCSRICNKCPYNDKIYKYPETPLF